MHTTVILHTRLASSTTSVLLLRINDDIMMTDASEFFFLSIASNLRKFVSKSLNKAFCSIGS